MGSEVVFPAAGFMAMAIEAIFQRHMALHYLEEARCIETPRFRFRDITFDRALVLEDGKEQKIMCTLHSFAKDGAWHEYVVSSLSESRWSRNSRGLIRIEEQIKTSKPCYT